MLCRKSAYICFFVLVGFLSAQAQNASVFYLGRGFPKTTTLRTFDLKDGTSILMGESITQGIGLELMMRIRPDGTIIWAKDMRVSSPAGHLYEVGQRLYVVAASGQNNHPFPIVYCVDKQTGAVLWSKKVKTDGYDRLPQAPYTIRDPFAGASLASDGNGLWISGQTGDTATPQQPTYVVRVDSLGHELAAHSYTYPSRRVFVHTGGHDLGGRFFLTGASLDTTYPTPNGFAEIGGRLILTET